jgi:PAS domain S-box-containing protein
MDDQHKTREQLLEEVRNLRERLAADVTEHRRAVEALSASEQRYRSLFEHNPAGVVRSRPDGQVVDCNASFARLLGYAGRAEILTRRTWDFYFHRADREDMLAALQGRQVLANYEVRLRRQDGSPVWALASVSLLGGGDIQGVYIDITERKRLQEQFLQAQKMEAVGRLAGGVAHDFNNLLTVITGYGGLLRAGLNPSDPLAGHVREIEKAADRAAGLTGQLLAFGRRALHAPRVLDLNTLVQDAEKMLRRVIGEDIELVTALEPALGRVKADPGHLHQVIMNLAVNARDAMPRGGTLTIRTANADLGEEDARVYLEVLPGPYVRLAVSDTGCGMTEEVRARLFEPFFTTKEVGKGTGLGLSTVYGIVRQSGGRVEVATAPGGGSTFTVYLPRAAAERSPEGPAGEPEGSPPGPPAPGAPAATVLLVEDEETVRGCARLVLERNGYTVLEAADGPAALLVAQRHPGPVHLLVADVVMPGMSGRQLAECLAGARPGLKVLYLSGYTDDAVVRHGVPEAGAAFLPKPFTPDALAHKVREVLESRE